MKNKDNIKSLEKLNDIIKKKLVYSELKGYILSKINDFMKKFFSMKANNNTITISIKKDVVFSITFIPNINDFSSIKTSYKSYEDMNTIITEEKEIILDGDKTKIIESSLEQSIETNKTIIKTTEKDYVNGDLRYHHLYESTVPIHMLEYAKISSAEFFIHEGDALIRKSDYDEEKNTTNEYFLIAKYYRGPNFTKKTAEITDNYYDEVPITSQEFKIYLSSWNTKDEFEEVQPVKMLKPDN